MTTLSFARSRSLRSCFTALLALACLAAPRARADAGWEQISQKDGVTVERRPRPGSSFYELRARAVIPIAPQTFFATVWSYRDYPEFVPYLKSLRVVGEQPGESVLYQQIAMPLVSDRDYTVRFYRAGEGETLVVRFDSADALGPAPSAGYVRAQNIHGSWTLEPADGGRATQVTYQLYSEPGGAVPSWIVNVAQKDAPRDLLLAMARRAQASKPSAAAK